MTTAIAVEDLTFRYAGRKRPCLRDVSFAIAPGETVLILGPSGCGKSTLALCLNGLIPHVIEGELSGHVSIAGRDTRDRLRTADRDDLDAAEVLPDPPRRRLERDPVADSLDEDDGHGRKLA